MKMQRLHDGYYYVRSGTHWVVAQYVETGETFRRIGYDGIQIDEVGPRVPERKQLERNAETAKPIGVLADLVNATQHALEHCEELSDAWQRGCISEHDAKGGTRSNRNQAVEVELRAALRRLALPRPLPKPPEAK